MAEALRFTVKRRKRTTVEFYLDPAPGEDGTSPDSSDGPYYFTAPKSAMMVLPIVTGDADDQSATLRAVFDWLGTGLNAYDWAQGNGRETVSENGAEVAVPKTRPEEWMGPQAQRIEKRLRDPEDDLDIDSLSEVIKGLAEEAGERPTT